MQIIGYFHICQKGEWKRSFNMIMDAIIESGLYENCIEIRCGVLNDSGEIENDDVITNYSKLKIIYVGHSPEYERPTLLHMRHSAEIDHPTTKYFYVHTKGLQWFGTCKEQFVLDWIKLLIYWNLEKWRDAENILDTYDTYGCNYHKQQQSNFPSSHYSGNFFWATQSYLNTLPSAIANHYNDPEFWICLSNSGKHHSAFDSGCNHYESPFPESNYKISC